MSKGPNGEYRPGNVVGCAVRVAKVATGEVDDPSIKYSGRTKSGLAGASARAKKLSKVERSAIAKKAANARWG